MYGTELIFNFFPLVTNFHQLGSSKLYDGSNDQMYGWADQTYNGCIQFQLDLVQVLKTLFLRSMPTDGIG